MFLPHLSSSQCIKDGPSGDEDPNQVRLAMVQGVARDDMLEERRKRDAKFIIGQIDRRRANDARTISSCFAQALDATKNLG